MIAAWLSPMSFCTPRFPLGLPVTDTHRDRIIELDAGFRPQRNHDQLHVAHALGVVAGNRAPDDGGVDLALGKVLRDDFARDTVPGLATASGRALPALPDRASPAMRRQVTCRRSRAAAYFESPAAGLPGRRRFAPDRDPCLSETPARRSSGNRGSSPIPGRSRQARSSRYRSGSPRRATYTVTCCGRNSCVAGTHNSARASRASCEQLRDPVLESFALEVRERQIARIDARAKCSARFLRVEAAAPQHHRQDQHSADCAAVCR